MFLWTLLACTLGYDRGDKEVTLSFQQTKSAHHFYFDKALESSVKIVSTKDGREVGHASGNYFKIGHHNFIISAAHIISEGEVLVTADYMSVVELSVIYIDLHNDIVILIPNKDLDSIKPINYVTKKELQIIGETVVYAGFPANVGQSVFHGTIASCDLNSLLIQSFALPGASGSVIFDNKGMAIGVLSAIQMGYNSQSPWPQLHAGLVYASRLREYDKYKIEEIIVKWKSSR